MYTCVCIYTHTIQTKETLQKRNNLATKFFVTTWGNCNSAQPLVLTVRWRNYEQSSALTCMVIMLVAGGQISLHASTGSAYHTSVWIPKLDKSLNVTTLPSLWLPPSSFPWNTFSSKTLYSLPQQEAPGLSGCAFDDCFVRGTCTGVRSLIVSTNRVRNTAVTGTIFLALMWTWTNVTDVVLQLQTQKSWQAVKYN